jgi:hypothetical protein
MLGAWSQRRTCGVRTVAAGGRCGAARTVPDEGIAADVAGVSEGSMHGG